MSSTIINGTDLVLTIDGVAVAAAEDHSISITAAERSISSKDSGQWEENTIGRFSWETTVNGMVSFDSGICNYATLATKMLAKSLVGIQSINATGGTVVAGVVTPLAGAYILSGSAIITKLDQTNKDADNVTFTCTFKGTGALTPVGALAVSSGAGLITATAASLVGLVASDGTTSAAISFDYGTTAAFGSTGTSSPTTTASAVPITAVAALSGLTTATTYFYRIKTVTGGVARYGATLSFRTA